MSTMTGDTKDRHHHKNSRSSSSRSHSNNCHHHNNNSNNRNRCLPTLCRSIPLQMAVISLKTPTMEALRHISIPTKMDFCPHKATILEGRRCRHNPVLPTTMACRKTFKVTQLHRAKCLRNCRYSVKLKKREPLLTAVFRECCTLIRLLRICFDATTSMMATTASTGAPTPTTVMYHPWFGYKACLLFIRGLFDSSLPNCRCLYPSFAPPLPSSFHSVSTKR